jgi:ATP-dependent protease ClpP protease subunit
MSKSLQVKVFAEGAQGRVDIIGQISEWGRNNAVDFRDKCTDLKNSGITNCHVYLMTVGGDCFQANEIVNILTDIFGSYTGEGGAIVASAGTYIGVCAKNFTMAKNGQYMIHKPSGWINGNETDVDNYLKLLKNMTVTYYDAYKAVLKKPEEEFKAKWDAGDFWMTAQEAKDWGFVSDIKEPVKIDQETAQAIQKSGSPIAVAPTDIIVEPNLNTQMDVKVMAITLGMDPNSTEEQVNARIAANAKKAGDYDVLKAQQEQREKDEKAGKIKAELDAAEKDKRIKADARAAWQTQFEKDFEGTKALLNGLQPIAKPLSGEIKTPTDGTGATYEGKTFEQLQDENPEALADLEENNPDAYNSLFADWKKRNKVK